MLSFLDDTNERAELGQWNGYNVVVVVEALQHNDS